MTSLLDQVESWCSTALPVHGATYLLNVRPTAAELAAHPKSLNLQAYFAGARSAAGENPPPFPRPLTDVEAESWADGWAEHRAEHMEVRRGTGADSVRNTLLGILDSSLEYWQAHRASPVADGLRQEAA